MARENVSYPASSSDGNSSKLSEARRATQDSEARSTRGECAEDQGVGFASHPFGRKEGAAGGPRQNPRVRGSSQQAQGLSALEPLKEEYFDDETKRHNRSRMSLSSLQSIFTARKFQVFVFSAESLLS